MGVCLHNLADGRGRFVQPCPTTGSEVRRWTQRVGAGGVSVVNTVNDGSAVCADNAVRALLPVGGHVTIGQVVTGQTLVFHDTSAVTTRQESRGSRPMWTSVDARPVAELTELL